jgi:hypothetical protein
MKKYFSIRNILAILAMVFLLAQLIPKKVNQSDDFSKDISTVHHIDVSVQQILKTSCYDCHSNHSDYPWYANVQPIRAWLDHHIDEGKGELNFSVFATYKLRRKYHKLEEIVEQVESNEMPMNSYTWTHRNAILSPEQKSTLVSWTKAQMDTLKAHYPMDSLVMKRK